LAGEPKIGAGGSVRAGSRNGGGGALAAALFGLAAVRIGAAVGISGAASEASSSAKKVVRESQSASGPGGAAASLGDALAVAGSRPSQNRRASGGEGPGSVMGWTAPVAREGAEDAEVEEGSGPSSAAVS